MCIFSLWYWGVNSGSYACWAKALPLSNNPALCVYQSSLGICLAIEFLMISRAHIKTCLIFSRDNECFLDHRADVTPGHGYSEVINEMRCFQECRNPLSFLLVRTNVWNTNFSKCTGHRRGRRRLLSETSWKFTAGCIPSSVIACRQRHIEGSGTFHN